VSCELSGSVIELRSPVFGLKRSPVEASHFPGLKPRAKHYEVPPGLSWVGIILDIFERFRVQSRRDFGLSARYFSAGQRWRNSRSLLPTPNNFRHHVMGQKFDRFAVTRFELDDEILDSHIRERLIILRHQFN
jgi:hypothetical protein